MTERDSLTTTLDALVPPFGDDPDWDDVLRRAGEPPTTAPAGRHRPRRRLRFAFAALGTLIAVCAVVLADPFAKDQRGVLDRALAAIGDGPVLHVVTRTGMGGTLVDLQSGDRTRIRVEREAWFDPARGFRVTSRLAGTVLDEYGASRDQPVRLHAADRAMEVFTRDYRDALKSGRARVLRKGTVAGTPVYWIRVEPDRVAPSASPCRRSPCQDVAVSRQTYAPVFVRFGPPGNRFEERILELESLPAGSGDIPGTKTTSPSLQAFQALRRRTADRSLARQLLRTPLVWPGRRVAGLALATIEAGGEREYRSNRPTPRPRFKAPNHVISLLFGERGQIRSGRPPRSWDRLLVVNEARRPTFSLLRAPRWPPAQPFGVPLDYLPPQGSALLTGGGRQATLSRRGLVITVIGSSPDLVRAALRELTRSG